MPSHHGIRLDDDNRIEAAGPNAIEHGPKCPIPRRQADPAAVLTAQRLQLMAQSHDFELQGSPVPEAREQALGEGAEKSDHAPTLRTSIPKDEDF